MTTIFTLPKIILLLVLALLSFFFALAETSIIGLSRIKLRHMLSKGLRRAKHIQNLSINMDKFITAILVGNNIVNIAMSVIITAIFVRIFGDTWGIIIAMFVVSVFILIVCEITPKILAIKFTERAALFVAPIMNVFIKVFNPIIAVFSGAGNLIIKILRVKPNKRSPLITEEELRLMIELGQEEGFLSREENKMLQRIFEFGDTRVGDVMVPKDKIVAININSTPEELLDIFVEEGHARLPVYKDSPDHIIGIIYARDLLYILRDKGLFVLSDLVHEPYYVTSTMQVNDLLKKFQADKVQIAVVADSHKKTVGLVTLEDLIEEIVGEIEERHGKHR